MPPQMDNISFRRYRISCRRRVSCRRHRLLRKKHLKVRQELKRECKELKHERKRMLMVKRETLKLHRALTPLGHITPLSSFSAPFVDARADVVCQCCFEAIKIDEYGDSPYEKCKECQRLLCSNCCFMSEKAPLWYCRMCVVAKRLLPIWRPTTEGRRDRVLSVSFQVRRRGRVCGEAMLA